MTVGLTNQTTNESAHESHIDYAVHCEAGTFTVHEGGSRRSSHGAYASSDVLEVRYTVTGRVEYIRDGTVVASWHKGAVGNLHVAISFYDGAPAAVTAIEVQSAHEAATNLRSALSPSVWSTRWDSIDFTHMMLASGDCKKWVVMTTIHALEWIQRSSASSPTLRQAVSSVDSEYHTVHALKRRGNPEDPTVYLESEGYAETCAGGNFMYKGNRVVDCATGLMRANAGSNVFYHIGTAPDPCDGRHIYGGEWSLKRHVPVGLSWHPATDWLHGSEVYGTNNALPNPVSYTHLTLPTKA